MNKYIKYFKIKDDWDLNNLIALGFERVDYSKDEVGYRWKGIQYEIKDYYPIEDDGTQYINNCDTNYNSIISVSEETRVIWIEIFNNDCSYHNEGDEVNFIANIFYELTKADAIERCEQ